mgnify:CR=1 FL=1|tara:strand:- start:7850 stop:8512 length:663 start_codon:yes stop_codon:yes gene_type:complete
MKTLLFGLLLLSAWTSHASSDFEIDFAFGASTNYKAKNVNEDGTVSITLPKFSNPTGAGSIPIDSESNLDGVCKLYGLGSFVKNSLLLTDTSVKESIIINEIGRYSRITWGTTIKHIACQNTEEIPINVSKNYKEIFVNDDESVTIMQPRFRMNGVNLAIAGGSNLNAVCKFYGFKYYVDKSFQVEDYSWSLQVIIGPDSRFADYRNSSYFTAKSLMCRN